MLIKSSAAQTLDEEIVNAATHAVGLVLGVIALLLLLIKSKINGDFRLTLSVSIYGCSLILAYLSSMIYHAIQFKPLKDFLRILDHSSIYLLIAGTYTPFTMISIGGITGWSLFTIIWLLAIIGILYKWFFFGRWPAFSIGLYIFMGWLAIIAIEPIFKDLPLAAIIWLFIGGLFYTLGILFFAFDYKIKYFHALWHLCVLAGSACHFFAVLFYVKI